MALRNVSRELQLPMPVWDGATRLFHWSLAVAVAVSYGSGWSGLKALHRSSGFVILALLLFRLMWGFVGSDTARFAGFLGSPLAALRQLAELPARTPDTQVGHTAACGWMTIILLALLATQVGSGLVADAAVHALLSEILLGAIALHLLAILAYAVVKRHNLVRPMITGRKRLRAATPAPRMANPLLALALMVAAGAVAWIVAAVL
jgi:cytochrome b